MALVKRKHDIIERENDNKPKSDGSRRPGCLEEKAEAIENAVRYFQMTRTAYDDLCRMLMPDVWMVN